MMKRLLVLLLVLGLASAANAAVVEFQIADGQTIAAGESIVINLYSDTPVVGWSMGKISATDGAGSGTVQNTAGWGNFSAGYLENTPTGEMFTFVEGYETGATTHSGILASFTHVIASDWDGSLVTISSESGSYYSPGDAATYNVTTYVDLGALGNVGIDSVTYGTPEPMTVALLGLGGLFLRRKK